CPEIRIEAGAIPKYDFRAIGGRLRPEVDSGRNGHWHGSAIHAAPRGVERDPIYVCRIGPTSIDQDSAGRDGVRYRAIQWLTQPLCGAAGFLFAAADWHGVPVKLRIGGVGEESEIQQSLAIRKPLRAVVYVVLHGDLAGRSAHGGDEHDAVVR